MPRTATAPVDLRKGAKVVARTELRGVPEGTEGKVTMVTGLTWIRYWVRFDNGVALGTIDRKSLATPDQWRRILDGEEETEVGSDAAAEGAADDAVEVDSGGGATTANGTFVPQLHIDRAKAARARLTG